MIEITESAVRQLRTLVGVDAAEKGLRIGIAKGGCSGLQYEMTLGAGRPGDAVIERDGVKFFVDEESAQLLRGSTLDYRDALTALGFRSLIRMPRAPAAAAPPSNRRAHSKVSELR